MATWDDWAQNMSAASIAALEKLARQLGEHQDALNLANALFAHMRRNRWSYGPDQLELAESLSTRKLNCVNVASLLKSLYLYYNRNAANPDVPADIRAVHERAGQPTPVYLPQTKLQHSGLVLDKNVQPPPAARGREDPGDPRCGVFFSLGHWAACLSGTYYDPISGHKGNRANMNLAYRPCREVRGLDPARYEFDLENLHHLLDHQPNEQTLQGLAKFTCT